MSRPTEASWWREWKRELHCALTTGHDWRELLIDGGRQMDRCQLCDALRWGYVDAGEEKNAPIYLPPEVRQEVQRQVNAFHRAMLDALNDGKIEKWRWDELTALDRRARDRCRNALPWALCILTWWIAAIIWWTA